MSERKGEGSYDGSEKFQKDQHKFAKDGPVDKKAREAAEALDGKEGAELERARKTRRSAATDASPCDERHAQRS